MCASPPSPRHAQPDWMGGGLMSRQMTHAPASDAISVHGETKVRGRRWSEEPTVDFDHSQPCDAPTRVHAFWLADAVARRIALPH